MNDMFTVTQRIPECQIRMELALDIQIQHVPLAEFYAAGLCSALQSDLCDA